MVGYDHNTKKDAFYLYRAVWNDIKPTLHITEGDWQSRTDTVQNFTVYSSVGEPVLLVNGDSVTMTRTSRGIYRSDTVVIKGRANIEAIDSTATYRHKIDINCGGLLPL
jgi:beta-galactosidase